MSALDFVKINGQPIRNLTPREVRAWLRKGPIYQAMMDHHDELAASFAIWPPSWADWAKVFTDAGLTGANGAPPTPASVRATWRRVHAQATRQREP